VRLSWQDSAEGTQGRAPTWPIPPRPGQRLVCFSLSDCVRHAKTNSAAVHCESECKPSGALLRELQQFICSEQTLRNDSLRKGETIKGMYNNSLRSTFLHQPAQKAFCLAKRFARTYL